MTTTLRDVIASLPQEEQERIKQLTTRLFADMGLANADELSCHGAVGCQVVIELRDRNMTHEEIAMTLGINLDSVAHLMNGHFDQFTSDDLMGFLTRLYWE